MIRVIAVTKVPCFVSKSDCLILINHSVITFCLETFYFPNQWSVPRAGKMWEPVMNFNDQHETLINLTEPAPTARLEAAKSSLRRPLVMASPTWGSQETERPLMELQARDVRYQPTVLNSSFTIWYLSWALTSPLRYLSWQQGDHFDHRLTRAERLQDVGVGVEDSGSRLQVDQTGKGVYVLKQIVRKFKQFPFCVVIMIVKLLYGVNVVVIIT